MLDSLHIKNFRCFEDLTIPSLGRVNLIVGKNNSGKSTLLEAIMFFATVGDSSHRILKNRGDHLLTRGVSHIDYRRIYFHGKEPDSFENRLEIGETKKEHILIIFNLINSEKDLLINYLEYAPSNIHAHQYAHGNTIYIENKEIIEHAPGAIHPGKKPVFYCPTYLMNEDILADMWDGVFLTEDDSIIKEALQIIEENAVNIAFIPTPETPNEKNEKRFAAVKIRNKPNALPIKALGDGMSRILQIFLYALQANKGFLLIDEFENGLHYSIQEEVWEKLFKLAKELDIQVFATTHSEDTIKAFCKVSLHSPEEGHLISLGRSAYGEDKGKIIAIVHDENDLQYILDTGMEVR